MKEEIDKAINGLVSFGRDLRDVHVMRDALYQLVTQNNCTKYSGVELSSDESGIYVWFVKDDNRKSGLLVKMDDFWKIGKE